MFKIKKGWTVIIITASLLALYSVHAHETEWQAPADAKKVKNPIKPSPESVNRGKEIYQKKCLMCHGETGDGNGPMSQQLKTKPHDLTDSKMMQDMTDGELFWKITTGRDPMPRFEKMLSSDERWHVVNYVRTLSSPGQGSASSNSNGKKVKN